VLGGLSNPAPEHGSGRLALAKQIADPANPLTSRVMVNRIWHHLFGVGIVPSVDNFGVLGQPPTHPDLLDHLADRFVKGGWSVKRLIRAVVLTRTYRMASRHDDASVAAKAISADPDNALLSRMRVRRLEAEAIRDAILSCSGRLDTTMFGRSVPVYLTPFMEGRGRPGASGPLDGAGRRSIYTAIRRNFLPPMMMAFDMPTPYTTVGRRGASNVPAQALILMNDPFVAEQAKRWAQRVLAEEGVTAEQRVRSLYLTAFSRPPSDAETQQALAFLRDQGAAYGLDVSHAMTDERPWTDLCHVLFNVKEFIFLN
jgi:hypothetical protein